jgi:hypothetical protein
MNDELEKKNEEIKEEIIQHLKFKEQMNKFLPGAELCKLMTIIMYPNFSCRWQSHAL